MTDRKQVETLGNWGVDLVGFIFHKGSPRYVLKDQIKSADLESTLPGLSKVGVFVNEPMDQLLAIAEKWKLDYIQLHGDETPDYCQQLQQFLPVIKAFRIGPSDQILDKVKEFDSVSYFLFDTLGKQYGGTGEKFNWDQLLVPLQKPYFISGGIGPDDFSALSNLEKKSVQLYGIDINSKFEEIPGYKNLDKISSFIEQLKTN